LRRRTLVEEVAVGAPSFESRLHRWCRYRQIEKTERSLVRLQLPRHLRILLRSRLGRDAIKIHCNPAIQKRPPRLG
jgi:hypothetical protein